MKTFTYPLYANRFSDSVIPTSWTFVIEVVDPMDPEHFCWWAHMTEYSTQNEACIAKETWDSEHSTYSYDDLCTDKEFQYIGGSLNGVDY